MIKKAFLLIGTLYCCTISKAQESGENHVGSWFMLFATHTVSEQLSIHSEIQYRSYEFANNFNQLLLRTGLNYHFSDHASATIGYGYIPTDPTFVDVEGEENIKEHRIFEQFVLKNAVGKFKFSHRYRLEHRFLDHPVTGKDTQHRVRYLLRITYPLDPKWFITAYDEVFVNLQEPLFGQNRLYGAIGYHISKNMTMQVGYLKNHFTGTNYDRFQLGIWLQTDWRKKSKQNKDD